MIEVFGEELGCRMFRKVAPWYAKRFGPCHEFNKQVVQVASRRSSTRFWITTSAGGGNFWMNTANCCRAFNQPPIVASFMRETEPASTRREHIPVPKGPVEVW